MKVPELKELLSRARKENDTPMVHNGIKFWFKYGILHRVNGPAMEGEDGAYIWFRFGKRHRIDGPAVMLSSGATGWFYHGIRAMSPKHFQKLTKISDEQLETLLLKFGSISDGIDGI